MLQEVSNIKYKFYRWFLCFLLLIWVVFGSCFALQIFSLQQFRVFLPFSNVSLVIVQHHLIPIQCCGNQLRLFHVLLFFKCIHTNYHLGSFPSLSIIFVCSVQCFPLFALCFRSQLRLVRVPLLLKYFLCSGSFSVSELFLYPLFSFF